MVNVANDGVHPQQTTVAELLEIIRTSGGRDGERIIHHAQTNGDEWYSFQTASNALTAVRLARSGYLLRAYDRRTPDGNQWVQTAEVVSDSTVFEAMGERLIDLVIARAHRAADKGVQGDASQRPEGSLTYHRQPNGDEWYSAQTATEAVTAVHLATPRGGRFGGTSYLLRVYDRNNRSDPFHEWKMTLETPKRAEEIFASLGQQFATMNATATQRAWQAVDRAVHALA